MKKRAIRILIIILLIVLFISGYICFFPIKSNTINRMILLPFEKMLQKKIEFTASNIWLPGRISLEDVSVTDKSGRLYHCKTISFRYNIARVLFGTKELSFNLKAIKLYRDIDLLDSVSTMLEISKIHIIEFENIEGAIRFYKDGIYIKRVHAYNDAMRINGEGWINKEGVLNCTVNFSFNKDIADGVPEIGKLKDEGSGWMGISLKATGNYKRPSLRISTDLDMDTVLGTDTIIFNIKEGFLKNE